MQKIAFRETLVFAVVLALVKLVWASMAKRSLSIPELAGETLLSSLIFLIVMSVSNHLKRR